MKIALAQLNTIVGDIRGNTARVIKQIQAAKGAGVDLVCFHEMVLTGYPPRDILEVPSFIEQCEGALAEIASHCHGLAVVLGSVTRNMGVTGKPLQNVAHWLEYGEVRHTIAKQLLPTYDVFDEHRYFQPGEVSEVIEYQGLRIGITICEDIWYGEGMTYPFDPIAGLKDLGAQFVINISSSPYSLNKFQRRVELLKRKALQFAMTVIYVNQVGGNDELIFDGGSMVINAQGELRALAPFFKEGITVYQVGEGIPLSSSVDDWTLLDQALAVGLKDYCRKCGFKQVALGLSGGIDSSVTAVIAVKALGKHNVFGLIMPSRYSSPGSVADARLLAKRIGITTKQIPIDPLHRAYERTFLKLFGRTRSDVTEENIQARIRGNLLMALSNKRGYLVLTTGNKSEYAVGYSTLYGDMSGGLAVIADLPKTMVYQLARHINLKREIIPGSVLTKPPSAELRPNQTDQDSLPPYPILDEIIRLYVEELASEESIVNAGFERRMVRRVLNLIRANEYKRRQAPLGLRVTSKAFGMGRRFPIACKW